MKIKQHTILFILYKFNIKLFCFPEIPDRPSIKHNNKHAQHPDLGQHVAQLAAISEKEPHHLNIIPQRINISDHLSPSRHTVYRRPHPAQQTDYQQKEETKQHRLLLIPASRGNQYPEAYHGN